MNRVKSVTSSNFLTKIRNVLFTCLNILNPALKHHARSFLKTPPHMKILEFPYLKEHLETFIKTKISNQKLNIFAYL